MFEFDIVILLNVKTHNVPQSIGASLHNIEIVDLGIELLEPLALDRKMNPSNTLVLAIESL